MASDHTIKLEKFNEFFSIDCSFNLNINFIDEDKIPSYEVFMEQMPLPFKIASDIVNLDQAALKPIQGLDSIAGKLVEYLHHQTQKIDLLVSYIIHQQDDEKKRFLGVKLGGGGLIFTSSQPFKNGQHLELKVFLEHNSCAIYCLGEVIEITPAADEHHHTVVFHHIRDEDRGILVRSSLHEQSKQLQALAQQRSIEKHS